MNKAVVLAAVLMVQCFADTKSKGSSKRIQQVQDIEANWENNTP